MASGPGGRELLLALRRCRSCIGVLSGLSLSVSSNGRHRALCGPLVLAPLSASRGDGDGLWVFQFLYLAILGVAFGTLAGFGARVARRSSLMRPFGSSKVLTVVAAIAIAIAASLVWTRWPNPWADLEASIDGFHIGSSFRIVQTTRAGSALCSSACGPSVSRLFVTNLSDSVACDQIKTALFRRGVRISLTWGCSYQGELTGGPLGRVHVTATQGEPIGSDGLTRFELTVEASR